MKGKKVLITGASQNIGEELAYQYSKLGADIVITARRVEELERVTNIMIFQRKSGQNHANYLLLQLGG